MSDSASVIPVIDFDQLSLCRKEDSLDSTVLGEVGRKLAKAFREVGFCYLKNHGISQELIDEYFDVSRNFFQQPNEEKMKHVRGTELNFGWTAIEREQVAPDRPGDFKEAFDYHPADDHDEWQMVDFREGCQRMFKSFSDLTYRVCDALSVGLGLGESFMRDAHGAIGQKENPTQLRSLFYPAVTPGSNIKPRQIRLGEHSDYGTITLLIQDDTGGLEIDVPGIGYVEATPIPGTVVVNIGELMERWSSDELIATKHRILIPETELKKRTPRQSVVFFVFPYNDYIIECRDGSKKYEPISSLDYLNYRLSTTY